MSSETQAEKQSLFEELKWLFEHSQYTLQQQADLLLFLQRNFLNPWHALAVRIADAHADDVQKMVLPTITNIMKDAQQAAEFSRIVAKRASVHAREAEQKSLESPVTGLLNTKGFYQELNKRLRTRRVHGWALFYMDLRNFKPWNNTYTHAAGDLVLKVFAKLMTRTIRPEHRSELFNPSGDEFAALFNLRTNDPIEALNSTEHVIAQLCSAVDTCDWVKEIRVMARREGIVDPLGRYKTKIRPVRFDAAVVCWLLSEAEPVQKRKKVSSIVQKLVARADTDMSNLKKAVKRLPNWQKHASSYQVATYTYRKGRFQRLYPKFKP